MYLNLLLSVFIFSDAYIVACPDMCRPCKYILQFLFYLTLAKVVKRKNAYMYNLFGFVFAIYCHSSKIKKKKQDPYFSMGKKLKSYATLPQYLSFLLGKGGKLLCLHPSKNFKTSQSALSDHKSLQHTCLNPQCVCDTLQNCPFLQNYMYILCEFHLSSNRRGMKFHTSISVCDPTQRTHSKIHETHKFPACPHPESHEFLSPQNYLQLETRESSKSTQKGMNFKEMHSLTPVNFPRITKVSFKNFALFTLCTYFQDHFLALVYR